MAIVFLKAKKAWSQASSHKNGSGALFGIDAHVILVNLSKHLLQIYHMLGHAVRLEDYIVHVDFDIPTYMSFEDQPMSLWYVALSFFNPKGMTL